jgi:DNA repair protein RecN (Recombination protein N)
MHQQRQILATFCHRSGIDAWLSPIGLVYHQKYDLLRSSWNVRMLTQLSLHHFALAEHLDLDVAQGFTVLTGETGAGKSLLLDGLSACLGDRADSNSIRFGHDKADVSAQFEISHLPIVQAWLQEHELDDQDGISLRRVLLNTGRSKGWINGRSVSMTELRELGSLLVHLNSQHSQQQLLAPQYPRDWLDIAAHLVSDAEQVRLAYQAWQQAKKHHQQALHEQHARQDRLVLLQSQIDDLEPLTHLDYPSLEQEFDQLSHFEQMMQDVAFAVDALDGEQGASLSTLGHALRRLDLQISRSARLQDVQDQLLHAQASLQDATRGLRQFLDQAHFDPERLQELDGLMAEFHRLARKYRCTPVELAERLAAWQQELQQWQQLSNPETLAHQVDSAWLHYQEVATALDTARQQAAPALLAILTAQVKPLALPEVRFEFEFTPYPQPQADGLHEVCLLFSANQGMPLQPLAKIASGGELSRIALVMQVMIATHRAAPVLIFDEVDVGISGSTAEIVGRLLRQLGEHVQVICITHQAQVAAQGHQHLLVEKLQQQQAASHIRPLTPEERILELARMSGGVEITDQTLGHARQLFEQANHLA